MSHNSLKQVYFNMYYLPHDSLKRTILNPVAESNNNTNDEKNTTGFAFRVEG